MRDRDGDRRNPNSRDRRDERAWRKGRNQAARLDGDARLGRDRCGRCFPDSHKMSNTLAMKFTQNVKTV